MKRMGLALVVSAALAAFAPAWAATGRGENLLWKMQAEAKLRQRMDFTFAGEPLGEVLRYFSETLGLNIVVDPADIQARETPVTLALTDARADVALRWALQQADLKYVLADGAVFISTDQRTMQAEAKHAYLKSYDVNDLMVVPAAVGGSTATGSTGNTNDNTNGGSSNAADDLMRLIVTFTGPENWDQVIILGRSNTTDENTAGEDRF